ncbi:MAG: EfeM/EfeO family lipoprotein [Candidatus Eremiobacteraeota bacterium]|nr:EfeM/EfeO family lipoprotein [Candidatus Eremiobacteraeota bacterium]
MAVTLTNAGCEASSTNLAGGPHTFTVTNKNATAVSEVELLDGERILGEKENLAPGFSGSFSLQLSAGTYSLYCPGATKEKTPVTVTGGAVASTSGDTTSLVASGVSDYATYIRTQIASLVATTGPLVTAIEAGNVAAAQQAYAKARPYYERVEPVAESFTQGSNNLDNDIDARENDVPASQWEGFHRIEQGLFVAKSTAGLQTYATGLLTNVTKLQTLTSTLTYQPAELANGAVELLDEVSKTKITGEEERYSHLDLLDMEANIEGSEQAYADLQPVLVQIDPQLAATLTADFGALDALVNTYRDPAALGGFKPYGQLTPADVLSLSRAVSTVAEPLSQVAAKVVAA